MLDTEVAELLLKTFKGNPNYVAHAPNGGTFSPYELKQPLTVEKMQGHLDGKYCLGFYLMDGNNCHVSCVDFDNHDGKRETAIMDARTVVAFLIENGFDPILEISQSGQGAHVWLVNPHPLEAAVVRLFWKGVLKQCQLSGVEIYPRQDTLDHTSKSLGNLIRYPLYGESHFENHHGDVLSPRDALNVEPASAYDLRTKGELWFDEDYQTTRKSRFETEGLPDSVRELLHTEDTLARRWAGDVGGLSDGSRSSLVMSLALELVRRYVPTPEIIAALKFWAEKEGYEKALKEGWLETTLAKAYGYVKGHAKQDTSKSGSLAAAVHRYVDRRAAGLDILIPSGIPAIDEAIGGAQFGELVVVGCRTSNGKSALTIQWLHNTAMLGYAGSIISLEMSVNEVAARIAARLGLGEDVSLEECHEEIDRFYRRAAPIDVVTDAYHIDEIEQAIRYRVSKGVRVFVIDHMGKVEGGQDERTSFAAAYKRLSKLCKTLDIIIIACQQRNRKADEDGEDPNPKLNSLHGSGAIEQDADIILFGRHLYREEPIAENRDRYVVHAMKSRNHRIIEPVRECRYIMETQQFCPML